MMLRTRDCTAILCQASFLCGLGISMWPIVFIYMLSTLSQKSCICIYIHASGFLTFNFFYEARFHAKDNDISRHDNSFNFFK